MDPQIFLSDPNWRIRESELQIRIQKFLRPLHFFNITNYANT
jgi:hypothetical protein